MQVFTLESAGVRARILDYGATLMSLEIPDAQGRFADVVLGFDDPERYRGRHPYFGSIVGRYANRIAFGRFDIDGVRCRLACNDGRHHLHGGNAGFDRALWQGRQESRRVVLAYRARDGEEGYPGNLDASVTYSVGDHGLRIEYRATTDRPTVVNLTSHAYFNLAGRGAITAHEVRIPARRYVAVDDERIPTGELVPVAGSVFDLNALAPLGERSFDHCFVLDDAAQAELADPASGRRLRLRTSQPGLQLYTGNLLDGTIEGKGGRRYERHAALCIEPQHFPDSPNRPDFPGVILRPGQTYSHYAEYSFAA
jgi:aldose 1-epimerase